jgi:hypothetical protein
MNLWIVGQMDADGGPWHFQGVFSNENVARAVCGVGPRFFMAPCVLDVALPEEAMDWPGLVYPGAP